jgi:hypothetical protein
VIIALKIMERKLQPHQFKWRTARSDCLRRIDGLAGRVRLNITVSFPPSLEGRMPVSCGGNAIRSSRHLAVLGVREG